MIVGIWLWGILTVLLAIHADGKLLLNRLDQLESNIIGPQQPPPPSRVASERDWVKISEAPPLVINTRLGERVEIECEALGSPAPEVQWLRGDRAISQVRKTQSLRVRTLKATGLAKIKSRLVIECVGRKHEGFYTCAATAGGKTIKANPTLLLIEGIGQGDLEMCSSGVRQPPRIVTWTPTAMETMGADLRLPCEVLGKPAPSVYWMDPQNNILNSIRHQVSASGDLTILQLAWSDMGEYTCVAESPEGRDEVTTFVYPVMDNKHGTVSQTILNPGKKSETT